MVGDGGASLIGTARPWMRRTALIPGGSRLVDRSMTGLQTNCYTGRRASLVFVSLPNEYAEHLFWHRLLDVGAH